MALVKLKKEEFSELLAINKGTTVMGVCIWEEGVDWIQKEIKS
jgi:hypothetical protein